MDPDMREFLDRGLISAGRMRAVEGNAITLGVGAPQMMESAGRELAAMALEFAPFRALVLCGRGKNGGDGMVAARYLQHIGTDVIYASDGPLAPETELQLRGLAGSVVTLHPVRCASDVDALAPLFTGADVIVDALLGTGASGKTREPLSRCVELATATQAPIIAADIPTPGMRATRILSFHRAKVEGAEVADIGIPLAAEVFMGPGDLTLVPRRGAKARKGENGEVLVIGGGPYQGAPYLAGLGALRAGADIVRIASPVFEPVPELIYERLEGDRITPDHLERILKLVERADAVVVGNGLGTESHAVVTAIAPHCRKAVFDADALRLPLPAAKGETIYTPHAGEFTRITGTTLPDDTIGRARTARKAGIEGTILLKGSTDIITDGTRVRFNRTGDPAMTVGGTGDVLAGVCGALLCHLPAFEAACIAAYVCGKAGESVAAERGSGMLASDLVDRIPAVLFGKR